MSNGAWELAEDKIVKLELEKENYRIAGNRWKDKSKEQDKRIAELKGRLKESGRIMVQLAEAAEDDGVDGVRWRAIAGDAYDFLTAPEGNADD